MKSPPMDILGFAGATMMLIDVAPGPQAALVPALMNPEQKRNGCVLPPHP